MRAGRVLVICPNCGDVTFVLHAAELRMVEGIERLEPELEAQLLRNREVLEQRQVEVVDAGRAQDVATGAAKDARRWLREGALVEPLVNSTSGSALRVADEVRPVGAEGVEEAAGIRRRNRDRKSLLERGDAVHLPAANDQHPPLC